MNRLTKLLSLAALFSFGIATDNTEETIVEKSAIVEENTSNEVSTDQDIAPVDIEKIMKVRKAKAENEKLLITRGEFDVKARKQSLDHGLKDKGFAFVKLSELSFCEELKIFNDAETVVGLQGAGFANLIWSNKISNY